MKYIRPYKKLEVYTIGKELVLRVYELLSNTAEGLGRLSEKEQVRFIEIAYGSLLEVETQLDLAYDLRYITEEDLEGVMVLVDREARLLSGLRSRRMEKPVTHNP